MVKRRNEILLKRLGFSTTYWLRMTVVVSREIHNWLSVLLSTKKGTALRRDKQQKLFAICLEFPKSITRDVNVRASSREVAERRALKRNPTAIRVARGKKS